MKLRCVLLLLTFSTYSIAPSYASAASCFAHPLAYPTGDDPTNIVTGDFNNDGNLDFVDGYFNTCVGNGADIFLGDGQGRFKRFGIPQLDADPSAIIAEDFNGDGNLDLAVAYEGCSGTPGVGLAVVLGNGDGTFEPAQGYGPSRGSQGVAAGDFNGDGKIDLAVDVPSYQARHVWFGNGDGTFRLGRVQQLPWDPYWNKAGDFNGDGKLDLATNIGLGIVIQLGNGDGTFSGSNIYTGFRFALGDMNRDGILDIVTVTFEGQLVVYLGKGDGTMIQASSYPAPYGDEVAIGDLDGDGALDVVATNRKWGTVAVRKGAGDGTLPLQRLVEASLETGNPGTWAVAIGDFNSDGLTDFIAADIHSVNVLGNTGQCH